MESHHVVTARNYCSNMGNAVDGLLQNTRAGFSLVSKSGPCRLAQQLSAAAI